MNLLIIPFISDIFYFQTSKVCHKFSKNNQNLFTKLARLFISQREESKNHEAHKYNILFSTYGPLSTYVACMNIRMHELSREIPGKLEVRLSYNLVNDTKDSK